MTKTTPKPALKHTGAQPHNANAVSSGFYSRTFTDDEILEIGRLAITELSLDEEIGMLRVLIRRVLQSELKAEDIIQLCGRATGQLRRMMETRAKLLQQGAPDNAIDDAMSQALDELAEELGIDL